MTTEKRPTAESECWESCSYIQKQRTRAERIEAAANDLYEAALSAAKVLKGLDHYLRDYRVEAALLKYEQAREGSKNEQVV